MSRRILYYLLFVITVVVFVGAIIFVIANKDSKDEAAQKTAGSSLKQTSPNIDDDAKDSAKSSDSSSKKSSDTSATTGKSGSSQSGAGTTPATGRTGTGATATNSTQLANSGPGEVVAIFIGAVIVGTFAFSGYQRKALSR